MLNIHNDKMRAFLRTIGLLQIVRRIFGVVRRILCIRDLTAIYQIKSDLSPYVREFRAQARRCKDDSSASCEKWCKYMIALLETGKFAELQDVFAMYGAKRSRLKYISHFFVLSKYAVDHLADEPEISSTSELWDVLSSKHIDGSFKNFVAGKTVAVIGNGPSELGKGLGEEIDGHDIVIRMNNFQIKGYERDYGRRTDVWAKNNMPQIIDSRPADEPHIPFILYTTNWERESLSDKNKAAYLLEVNSQLVDYIGMRETKELRCGLNSHVTAGLLILYALRHCKIKYLDAYGFSFLQANQSVYSHYGTDISQQDLNKEISAHNISNEIEYCRALFNGGRRLRPLVAK